MKQIAENIWILKYPLKLLGMEIGRRVTVIRLSSGKVVVHSTAPFTAAEVAGIGALGDPAWLLDVSFFHDSFAKQGRAAFPHATYLVPTGFPDADRLQAEPISAAPAGWGRDLEIRKIEGMPKVQEHALFHTPSRTLIVADLLFNFGAEVSSGAKFVIRRILRFKKMTGMSPFFRLMIRDRAAFEQSIRAILEWDFDRVIVAHGEMIARGGKERVREIIR